MNPQPDLAQARLRWALLGSVIGNIVFWFGMGGIATFPPKLQSLPELVVDRVESPPKTLPPKPLTQPHPVVKKSPPPPEIKPKLVPEKPQIVSKAPPPETQHLHIVSAPPDSKPDSHSSFTAQPGGTATPGKPVLNPGDGNGTNNVPRTTPPKKQEEPTTEKAPPKVVTPDPGPKHTDPPKADPPAPPPPPPPQPKGETREAKPDHQETVEIPESLKSQGFKSFVRVRVTIAPDSKFTVILRTSSGNKDVDKLVLDTLNKWTWKPALKDGIAIESIQQFRFNFVIE